MMHDAGQKERDLAPVGGVGGPGREQHLTSTISKFGVGATQAGFYLGDEIRVRPAAVGVGVG